MDNFRNISNLDYANVTSSTKITLNIQIIVFYYHVARGVRFVEDFFPPANGSL